MYARKTSLHVASILLLLLAMIGWSPSARPVAAQGPLPGGTLDPTSIPKYVEPLIIPPAMPQTARAGIPEGIDYYEIAVRQFEQQVLPRTLPGTTVWSYGSINHPDSFNYPAFTVEAKHGKPVRVKWINDLKDANGRFLPHLLPVDPTLHWANPPGGRLERDLRPSLPGAIPYTGPVPVVVHLHGGENTEESDGYPEAWFLPAANNIPEGFAPVGRWYDPFKEKARNAFGVEWEPGTAVYEYANDQRATTLWYHDHALGITRLNVYAGPAGFYLLRGGPGDLSGGVLPGPAPSLGDPAGTRYFEIPLAIQDRSFNADGSLFYPDTREFFDQFAGPFRPESDISPLWNPEFFGNTMVVNGRTWPFLEVEQRRYRFRLLNGSDSRFLILSMGNDMPIWQIGADGGFLPAPVQLDEVLLAPAERADVIVDFTSVPVGSRIILRNSGPDEPFGGGTPGEDFPPSDSGTTGQVMQFRVVPKSGADTSVPPRELQLPGLGKLGPATNSRQVSLNEVDSRVLEGVGPREALLGTLKADGTGRALDWDEAITENPALNATEVWEIFNFTPDAHPIHIHEIQFEVVDRQPFGGVPRPPERWETGTKDTVIAYPDEITRVKAHFRNEGLFVWHCHILSHEDNSMMRSYFIGTMPQPPLAVEGRMSTNGDITTVDISMKNNTEGGIAHLEIRGTIPPGTELVATSPPAQIAGNQVVWFNTELLEPSHSTGGFQYQLRGAVSHPAIAVNFIGATRGSVETRAGRMLEE